MIVVDSNVLAARNLSSQRTRCAEQVEKKDPVWVVPQLWRYEFENILVRTVLAKQISSGEAIAVWRKVSSQMMANEHEPDPEKVLALSLRHRITGYDANFVALAMELRIQCVTEDGELLKKFPGTTVSMEDFVQQDSNDYLVREQKATYRTGRSNKN